MNEMRSLQQGFRTKMLLYRTELDGLVRMILSARLVKLAGAAPQGQKIGILLHIGDQVEDLFAGEGYETPLRIRGHSASRSAGVAIVLGQSRESAGLFASAQWE